MNLWYFDIDDFPTDNIDKALSYLPANISNEINRSKFSDDKKSRLIARLLVQKYFLKNKFLWCWGDWKTGENHKPFIENGANFNISHSGKMVVVAFSSEFNIGIDIEEIKNIEVESLSKMLHVDEFEYLKNNNFDQNLFYALWTRKEAFLKAIGTGILNGINHLSIINEPIYFVSTNWYLNEINISENYKCAVCVNTKTNRITIDKINYETLRSCLS